VIGGNNAGLITVMTDEHRMIDRLTFVILSEAKNLSRRRSLLTRQRKFCKILCLEFMK
jgi:hypothetical protein